ncbi:hypothetical protein R1flu_001175 [Riccia fluitans]|uniref:Subtilisin-like protease n=1 Tax=Riccia fluitans TaxID=41844 RepID=A0ABD1Y2J2_9MARC
MTMCCMKLTMSVQDVGKNNITVMLLMGSLFLFSVASPSPHSGSSLVSPSVYIVRLRGESVHQRASAASETNAEILTDSNRLSFEAEEYAEFLKSSHDKLLAQVLVPNSYEKLYSYTYLINALSVKLHGDSYEVSALRDHPDVLFMEHETMFQKATTHTPDFLGLPHGAWLAAGGAKHAGEDVVIGMLDTGINPSHLSFTSDYYGPLKSWKGKCLVAESFPDGSCNHKIVGAQYFAKGIIAANLFNATYDFDSPFDGDGHGTHTSSIAAGNSGVPVIVHGNNYGYASGVAPRARLAVYKVIYRDGGFLSDVLAGIDQAVQDGVHVLSVSLGSTSGTYGVPALSIFDLSLLFAVKAGVVVVHAAGNNGPYPLSMNSFGPWMISVASGLSDRSYPNPVIFKGVGIFPGAGFSAGTPGEEFYPLIHAEDAFLNHTNAYEAEYYSYCQDASPFNRSLVAGKILICNFVEYYSGGAAVQFQAALITAKNLSAVGLIILREPTDVWRDKSNSFDPIPFTMPASFVMDANASSEILKRYKQKTKMNRDGQVREFGAYARLSDSRVASYKVQAPQVSSFSARGPTYANTVTSVFADILKPDILAPGSQIWGAWSPTATDVNGYSGQEFALLSGTSMATPHVAGVVALLRQTHPNWCPSIIQSAILTSATQYDTKGRRLLAQQPSANASQLLGAGTPFDFGYGAVNPTAALDPGLAFKTDFQDHINFLCTLPGADANTVQDATGGTCRTAPGARSSDLNIPSITIANLIGTRTVRRFVTNVADNEETYTASIRHPGGVKVAVKPAVFTIKPKTTLSFHLTFKAAENVQSFTFGSLTWMGSKGHVVYMPLSISANSVTG